MKLFAALFGLALAGKPKNDGFRCNKVDTGNWSFQKRVGDNWVDHSTGHADQMTCLQAKCGHMTDELPASGNWNGSPYVHWVKKPNENADVLKFHQGFSHCGLRKDCQLVKDENDVYKCVTAKCKGREPWQKDGNCVCGGSHRCMCSNDGEQPTCMAVRPSRESMCVNTAEDSQNNSPDDQLTPGYNGPDVPNGEKWLFKHLGHNGTKCTWSGKNLNGPNHPASGKRLWVPHPDLANVCCRSEYKVTNKCPKSDVQSRPNYENEGCPCLSGYSRADAATDESKKHKRVVCKMDKTWASKDDVYVAINQD